MRGLVILGITVLVCILLITTALILFGIWMVVSYIHSSEYKRLKEEMKDIFTNENKGDEKR